MHWNIPVVVYVFCSSAGPCYIEPGSFWLWCSNDIIDHCVGWHERLRWSRGSVLAFGTPVRGFAPGRSRRIFRAIKIISTPSFGGEVKPSVPCRSFTACKRSLNVTWKSAFRQNSRTFLAYSSTFRELGALAWWHAWRRLVAKVGTSNPDRTISLEGCSAWVENNNNNNNKWHNWGQPERIGEIGASPPPPSRLQIRGKMWSTNNTANVCIT